MPKELIATRTETDNAPDGTVLETRTDSLYVAWGRQPGADSEAVQVTVRQETDHAGRELYSAGLTRAEINDLIRVLKRARRQTFENPPPRWDVGVIVNTALTPAELAADIIERQERAKMLRRFGV